MSQSSGEPILQQPPSRLARLVRALRFLRNTPGWGRVVDRLVPTGATGAFVVDNNGTRFAGDLGSYIDRQMYLYGEYEEPCLADFMSCVPSSHRTTILDIGANVGTHSLYFSKRFTQVHSFEPNPGVWPSIERNLALNNANNITLHKIGLGARNEDLTLYLTEKTNLGMATFSTVPQYDVPLTPTAICRVLIGDEYLASIGVTTCGAVKIDVQGFEPDVIAGLRGFLAASKPVVWFELGGGTKERFRSRSDVEALFPYPINMRKILQRAPSGSGAALDDPGLAGELAMGDYVVTPR